MNFGGEVVFTATYILNRCQTKRLDGITQEEWYGFKPNLSLKGIWVYFP